tara:strand:+ start:75 stop:311 length:237 start_codon:yes stop_codon:yes gene_type:complete
LLTPEVIEAANNVLEVHYTVLPMVLEFKCRRTTGEQGFKTNSVVQMGDESEEREENEIAILDVFSTFYSPNPIYLCDQ